MFVAYCFTIVASWDTTSSSVGTPVQYYVLFEMKVRMVNLWLEVTIDIKFFFSRFTESLLSYWLFVKKFNIKPFIYGPDFSLFTTKAVYRSSLCLYPSWGYCTTIKFLFRCLPHQYYFHKGSTIGNNYIIHSYMNMYCIMYSYICDQILENNPYGCAWNNYNYNFLWWVAVKSRTQLTQYFKICFVIYGIENDLKPSISLDLHEVCKIIIQSLGVKFAHVGNLPKFSHL